MGDVKVVMKNAGCNELRNSPAIQAVCLAKAQRIANAANGSSSKARYTADVRPGKTRAHARASTAKDKYSFFSERKHNRLLKALYSGGGL